MVITFPFSVCIKATGDKEDSIYCGECNLCVHIKCNNLNYIDYKYLSENGYPWFFLKCNSQLFPFGTLDNKKFIQHILHISNMKNNNKIEFSNLVLNLFPDKVHYLSNLITYLKHMIIKTLKML